MLLEDMQHVLPIDWYPMDLNTEKFKIITVPPLSKEFHDIEFQILGNYYSSIESIYKLQNPSLYTKYVLKAYTYEQKGPYEILSLFHDSPRDNVESIATYNFDWRYEERFQYGPGVYFSTSPSLANKCSLRYNRGYNTLLRTMCIVNVLVQNIQKVDKEIFLPDCGYDTVLANNTTYVKYYDCEYYPRYFVDYVSLW